MYVLRSLVSFLRPSALYILSVYVQGNLVSLFLFSLCMLIGLVSFLRPFI